MPQNPLAVLTPYLVPPALTPHKATNLGDGFILRAIERLVGRFDDMRIFTSRTEPSPQAREALSHAPGVILAGANQLNDQFSPWPGLTAEQLRQSQARLIPFGVGLHGAPEQNRGLSPNARELVEAIHERIEFSAWRCPLTVAFLEREVPSLAGRFLMTGCPVAYDAPVLEADRFHDGEARVAVTVTDREDFWDRETAILDFVAERFADAERFVVLHQDFQTLGPKWGKGVDPARSPQALRDHAIRRGYKIVIPASADAALALYEPIDLHIGSRLHAHLQFLSRNKRSFLVAVDDRARGLALAYGFPLSEADGIETLDLSLDFEPIRARIREGHDVMQRFVASLGRLT